MAKQKSRTLLKFTVYYMGDIRKPNVVFANNKHEAFNKLGLTKEDIDYCVAGYDVNGISEADKEMLDEVYQ